MMEMADVEDNIKEVEASPPLFSNTHLAMIPPPQIFRYSDLQKDGKQSDCTQQG